MDIGYNSVKDNGTYNASSAPDFAYSRVVESNTRFVNYLRNPLTLAHKISIPLINGLDRSCTVVHYDASTNYYRTNYYIYRRRSYRRDNTIFDFFREFEVYYVYYKNITVDKYNNVSSMVLVDDCEATNSHKVGAGDRNGFKDVSHDEFRTSDPGSWTDEF